MICSYLLTDFICSNKDNLKTQNLNNLAEFIDKSVFDNYSKNTTFSIAIMEWLMNGDFHTKKLMQLLYKYYKADENQNNYGKSLEIWLNSGAKKYRIDYECNAIAWCGIIAFVINDMNTLKSIIKRAIKATNNSESAFKYGEIVAIAIYLNRKYHSIEKTSSYIAKHYNLDINSDFELFEKTYQFSSTAKTVTTAGLNCFISAKDYADCISKALKLESNHDIIVSIAGLLAESYFGPLSKNIAHKLTNQLPKPFLQTILRFNDYTEDDFHQLLAKKKDAC